MRTKEGVGRVPPRRERVSLSDSDLAAARQHAWRIAKYRRYAKRIDDWGRGYFDDPAFPLYIGLAGEYAFRNLVLNRLGVSVEVDTSLKPRGDGDIDFNLCGYGVQVKTATASYDSLLVRCRDAAAPVDEAIVKWDVCVRVQWPSRIGACESCVLFDDGRRLNRNAADVCGVVWRVDFIRLATLEPGKGEGEWNYVIQARDFDSVSSLWDKCAARTMRKDRDDAR